MIRLPRSQPGVSACCLGIDPDRASVLARRSREDDAKFPLATVVRPQGGGHSKSKCRCVSTGRVFETVTQAADWAGCSYSMIYGACGKGFVAAGHKWEFVG